MQSAIVWDFDGTIADSYPGMVKATQYSLEKNFGINISESEIKSEVIKTSIRDYVSNLLLDENKVTEFYKNYRIQEKNFQNLIRLYPDTIETLDYFKKENITQFIITHRDNSIFDVTKKLGIDNYFEEIVSVSDNHIRKPDPEMLNYLISKYYISSQQLWVIGDRKVDIDFGNTVNAKTILIRNNEKTNSTYQVKNLTEIMSIIKKDTL
ncbi:HAD-IA family hydrolase [Companilactobacillus metriopterae]|uniref:HAD-IA family hydrolase n=1 Tax=Companilactobacillus metriopterae TaxID=1909267 RepID=UPI00100A83CD|nr:HAD-IA family hydrolase [Companilactobacillus metriopterae]